MTYIITILENIRKYDVYIGVNTHGIYFYLAMIGSPTTLTTSGQRYHNFGLSSSINKYTASLQPVIAALHMIHKTIYK